MILKWTPAPTTENLFLARHKKFNLELFRLPNGWRLEFQGEAERITKIIGCTKGLEDGCRAAERFFFETINPNNWQTPQYVFDYFDAIYHFDMDVCADAYNKKCLRFITAEKNALLDTTEWGPVNFCNCPYGDGAPSQFMDAAIFRASEFGQRTLMLLNYCLDTQYYSKHEKYFDRVTLLRGNRIQFIPPPGVKASTNGKGQMVIWITPESVSAQYGPRIETVHIPKPKKGLSDASVR